MKVSKGFLTVQTDENERAVPFLPFIRQKDIINTNKVGNEYCDTNMKSYKFDGNLIIEGEKTVDIYLTEELASFNVMPTGHSMNVHKGSFLNGMPRNVHVGYTQVYKDANNEGSGNPESMFDKVEDGSIVINSSNGYFDHDNNGARKHYDSTPSVYYTHPSCDPQYSVDIDDRALIWRAKCSYDQDTSTGKWNYNNNDNEIGWWEFGKTERTSTSDVTKWTYLTKSTSLYKHIHLNDIEFNRVISADANIYTNSFKTPKILSYVNLSVNYYDYIDTEVVPSQKISDFYVVADPVSDIIKMNGNEIDTGLSISSTYNDERLNKFLHDNELFVKIHIKLEK